MPKTVIVTSRKKILNQIFNNFQYALQWISSNPEDYGKYLSKAESLIEALEVEDCGSVGGYDKNNKLVPTTGFPLYDRFLCVARKHDNIKDIEESCGFNTENLGVAFSSIRDLRHRILKGEAA